jgi:hypothetical protein
MFSLSFSASSVINKKQKKPFHPLHQDSKIGGVSVVVLGQGVQLGRMVFFLHFFPLGGRRDAGKCFLWGG